MAVANDTGVNQSPQFTATSVYPYSYAPASYLGKGK
jgi:D-alanine-D-alanine ligase-like ATP-grasp enzyme